MLLSAVGLSCLRDDLAVFEPIDLALESGELLLLEGDNGAGKTTLLRALAGLREFEARAFSFLKLDIPAALTALRRESRWLGHGSALKAELTVAENWQFWAEIQGVQALDVTSLAERVALAGYEHMPVRTLSAGQAKRAQLARLQLGPAALWLLDEPFANLDRAGLALVEAMLAEHLNGGGAALVTSHGVLPFAQAARVVRLRASATC